MRLRNILFIALVLCLPMTGVFRLTEKLSLPILLASINLLWSKELLIAAKNHLLFFAVLLFFMSLTTMYFFTTRALVYTLSLCFSFLIFINAGMNFSRYSDQFFRCLKLAVWITSIYVS